MFCEDPVWVKQVVELINGAINKNDSNVNCFVAPIKKQIVKKITTEMLKAKCYQFSKQNKSENSTRSFANMLI